MRSPSFRSNCMIPAYRCLCYLPRLGSEQFKCYKEIVLGCFPGKANCSSFRLFSASGLWNHVEQEQLVIIRGSVSEGVSLLPLCVTASCLCHSCSPGLCQFRSQKIYPVIFVIEFNGEHLYMHPDHIFCYKSELQCLLNINKPLTD